MKGALNMTHVEWLKKYGACSEGVSFASRYETLQAAWDACTSMEHLRWVARAPIDDEYHAKRAPIDDEYASCDAFRSIVACPVVP